ncbi:30S ribosomal protein S13 [Candidatus Woesearchaeota archaeon]|nr:30S ribosomal protein S13 [Candidatus Woesearchaeota archaeon]
MAEKVQEKALPANFKHIVRIANVDLPGEKAIRFALTNIKGVGLRFADAVCVLAKVKRNTKTGTLSQDQINTLDKIVINPLAHGFPTWMVNRRKDYDSGEDKHLVTGNLNFVQENDLKRLKKIKTYRGIRHIHGQPSRGQRTRSNFRRNKGKVVGVAKKKAAPAAKK